MKNNSKFLRIIFSIFLCLSFVIQWALPVFALADDGIIYIGSAEELIEFAENCALDSWSRGKKIKLTADISLEGVEFSPIASFGGSLDGCGYTVSGLEITGAFAPAGLFARVEKGGSVANLTVEGCVLPEGDKSTAGGIVGVNDGMIENCIFNGTVIGKSDVGGIAGVNRIDGIIENCSANGEIIGDSRTGGIAGSNYGVISSSESEAGVNTVSITPTLTLDELNSYLTLDISRLPSLNTLSRNDTGGIAGYSLGMLLGCENRGEVGYIHIGYNVGGIVGRTSGHLSGNTNCAKVYGRKDVGGIAGHIEPYISYDLSPDLLSQLDGNLDKIGGIIDDLADALDGGSNSLSARLDEIIGLLGDASESVDTITDGIGSWGEDTLGEVNRLGLIVGEVLDRAALITENLPALSGYLGDAADSLGLFITELGDVSGVGREALADLTLCLNDLELALTNFNSALEKAENGLTALKASVKTDDSEGIRSALAQMAEGMSEAASAVAKVSSSMGNISDILGKVTDPDADNTAALEALSAEFDSISLAIGNMSAGMTKASEGLEYISAHTSLDGELALSGIEMLIEGLSLMADASVALEEAVAHLSDCTEHLGEASAELDEALEYLKSAAADLSRAADLSTEILTDLDGLVKYLAGVDPIQLPTPDGSVKASADELFITLSALEGSLSALNGEIKGLSGEITSIMRRLNSAFEDTKDTVISAIYGLTDTDSIYDDSVTPEQVASVTYGKIFDCRNEGDIYGDINAGGIGGIMGIELGSDPEDDSAEELNITQKRQYRLKAVIADCSNYGKVITKRDCAGGIAGKADMGLIYSCQSYCAVESEGGSFVGGIAGLTAADIIDCYTKCQLSGKKYIGGIVGSGVDNTTAGGGSSVKGCYAIVKINAFTQYAGAISGIEGGNFADNFFVAEGLRGIDRLNYQGKAEPIAYSELVKARSLPGELFGFTLTFLANGRVIHSVDFEYGQSFDSWVFPTIPEKEGYYSSWDRTVLENLTFDTAVSAVYHPFVTAIVSDESRENGKHIFIVQGNFTEGERLELTKTDANGLNFDTPLFYKGAVAECWMLTLLGENDIEAIRYLAEAKRFDIYIKHNGAWEKADTDSFGSYTLLDADGQQIQLAVVAYTPNYALILPLCIGAALLLCTAVIIIVIKKKRKANS